MTKYYEVSYSDGTFVEFSKEKKEGFEPSFRKSDGSLRGYTRGVQEVKGEFLSIRVTENTKISKVPVKELSFSLREENGDYVNIKMTLENMRGDYDNFAHSLIAHLPNLVKGQVYSVRGYSFIPKDSKYKKTGLSFKDANGEKVVPLVQRYLSRDGVESDGIIPPVIWKEVKGKPTADSTDQQTYLYEVLQKGLETFAFESNTTAVENNTSEPLKTEKEVAKKESIPSATEDDDLPF